MQQGIQKHNIFLHWRMAMQTCTKCDHQNADTVRYCLNCQADLHEHSNHAVTLKKFRSNSRVKGVRISVNEDACPACQKMRGSYSLDLAPTLPVQGCSHPQGCRCHYVPWLDEIYP